MYNNRMFDTVSILLLKMLFILGQFLDRYLKSPISLVHRRTFPAESSNYAHVAQNPIGSPLMDLYLCTLSSSQQAVHWIVRN